LKGEKHRFFGEDFFLGLCKENYKDFSMLKEDTNPELANQYSQSSGSGQRFNEWIPGYA